MPNRTLTVLFFSIFAISCSLAHAQDAASKSCTFDRARLLALDENQFDQDMSGGWRAISRMPGCSLAAADLLRDYREAHHTAAGMLFWHEAQIRADAGQYPEAIALMKRAYKPADVDKAGWNLYVDATIAFLSRNREALEQAKAKLAAVEPIVADGVPPVIDGYFEADMADGSKMKFRWPLNIDVVEGLANCFNKPYAEAYADECRPRPVPTVVLEFFKSFAALQTGEKKPAIDGGAQSSQYAQWFFQGFTHPKGGIYAKSSLMRDAYTKGQVYWRDHPSRRGDIFAAYGYVAIEQDGFYSHGFEKSAFQPADASASVWWMTSLGDVSWRDMGFEPVRSGPSRLHIVGYLSPKGQFGHLGAYEHEVLVTSAAFIKPASLPR